MSEPELKTPAAGGRIVSMDQFRGYTVFAMLIVNYVGKFTNSSEFLKHDSFWMNYADIIMPAFIFAVGFSFRLTILKRIPKIGAFRTYLTYIRRSLALCLVSIAIFGVGFEFESYENFYTDPYSDKVAEEALTRYQNHETGFWELPPYLGAHLKQAGLKFLKATLWETLALIGGTQLLVLPFIRLAFWPRAVVMLGFGLLHVFISHWFNWQFMFGWYQGDLWVNPEIGLNNWMGEIWQTAGRSWDGGCFGLLGLAFVMLAGSLCYDIQSSNLPQVAWKKLLGIGIGFLLIGYLLSCLACLYQANIARGASDQIEGSAKGHAASPVYPDFELVSEASSWFAPIPVIGDPPASDYYLKNYWMTAKRVITLPYALICVGLAMISLSFFVILSDIGGIKVRLFEMLGMNPLAAYFLHKVVWHSFWSQAFPKDIAPWMILVTFILFLMMVLGMIRSLEKQNIFIRM